ncbi:MAG: hypothetical protein ABJ205_13080 [Erythrobacter sp.]|uniref:hypothetical protein n=1 Tax=Erythrobacter sp. TaxID=1042 RepID=UPI003266833B
MINQKRFLAAILLASIVNTILMVTVFRNGNAIWDGRAFETAYWIAYRPNLGSAVFVQFFSLGFTGSGLFLLLGIVHHLVPKFVSGWKAKVVFVAGGAGLGFAITKLLVQIEIGVFFGAVTAVFFALFCLEWFEERRI